jgi:hypothetical protein
LTIIEGKLQEQSCKAVTNDSRETEEIIQELEYDLKRFEDSISRHEQKKQEQIVEFGYQYINPYDGTLQSTI